VDNSVAFLANRSGSQIEIVINFGLLTGREATLAEVDRLAGSLTGETDELEVVAARRHEYGHGREGVVHQVEVVTDALDAQQAERIRALCEQWAGECAADRQLDPLEL
jgi:hypothetical protein